MLVIVFDGDEAGEQATTDAVERLADAVLYWGRPRRTAEPKSQVVAMLEGEITRLHITLEAHLAEPESAGRDARVAELEHDLDDVVSYWLGERVHADSQSTHSRARSAAEYIALEAAAAAPIARPGSIDYKGIKEKIDIAEHVGRYTTLRRTGKNWTGRCPLPGHEDDHPSLTVYPDTRSFYCFGCHRGGDVIDFAQAMEQPATTLT